MELAVAMLSQSNSQIVLPYGANFFDLHSES